VKHADIAAWLAGGATPAEFGEGLAAYGRSKRAEFRERISAAELAELFRVPRRLISKLALRPCAGGGRGRTAYYAQADIRAYLVALNPSLKPWEVLPDSGAFLTPAELHTSLQRFGVALDVPAVRVTPQTIRYREQDVAAALAVLDDGSEVASVIRADWGEGG
jgi:hypothetical protein